MNTNEHLLKTRLASIAHYQNEIEKMEEAINVTRSTITDVATSLLEFNPLQVGSIFLFNRRFLKVKEIRGISWVGIEPCVDVRALFQDSHGNFNGIYTATIPITKLKTIKIFESDLD